MEVPLGVKFVSCHIKYCLYWESMVELRGRMMALYRTMLSMVDMDIRKCYSLKSVHIVVIIITKIHKQSITIKGVLLIIIGKFLQHVSVQSYHLQVKHIHKIKKIMDFLYKNEIS